MRQRLIWTFCENCSVALQTAWLPRVCIILQWAPCVSTGWCSIVLGSHTLSSAILRFHQGVPVGLCCVEPGVVFDNHLFSRDQSFFLSPISHPVLAGRHCCHREMARHAHVPKFWEWIVKMGLHLNYCIDVTHLIVHIFAIAFNSQMQFYLFLSSNWKQMCNIWQYLVQLIAV